MTEPGVLATTELVRLPSTKNHLHFVLRNLSSTSVMNSACVFRRIYHSLHWIRAKANFATHVFRIARQEAKARGVEPKCPSRQGKGRFVQFCQTEHSHSFATMSFGKPRDFLCRTSKSYLLATEAYLVAIGDNRDWVGKHRNRNPGRYEAGDR